MKSFIFKSFFLLLLLLSMTGCLLIPHTTEVVPSLKGRIIDIHSGQPICNAQITYLVKSNKEYTLVAESDDNGYFQIDAPIQWHYITYIGSPGKYPAPDSLSVYEMQICIAKTGYEKKVIVFYDKKSDIGTVKLIKNGTKK